MRQRKVIEKKYQVIVIGGGLSGVCAALASARQGASTAIVQSRSVFGGNNSSEVRMHVCGANCHAEKKDLAETGILMELQLLNKQVNPNYSFPMWDMVMWGKLKYNIRSFHHFSFFPSEKALPTLSPSLMYV